MQDDPVVEQATAAPGEHRNLPTYPVAQAARILLHECGDDLERALAALKWVAR